MKKILLTFVMAVALQCGYSEDGRVLCDLTQFGWCETSSNELICGIKPQSEEYSIDVKVQCAETNNGKTMCIDPRFGTWRLVN